MSHRKIKNHDIGCITINKFNIAPVGANSSGLQTFKKEEVHYAIKCQQQLKFDVHNAKVFMLHQVPKIRIA
jgi:hypothetical protein